MINPDCGGRCICQGEDGTEQVCACLYYCIDKVKEEWQNTKALFNEATGNNTIDYLIYKLNACERKYAFLLKIAQEEGLHGYPKLK